MLWQSFRGHRAAWFPLISACYFVDCGTFVVCNAFMPALFWLISIARYVFSLQVLLSRDKIWHLPCIAGYLLAFYIVTPGLAEISTAGRSLSWISYLPSHVFLRRCRNFTSRKLYAFLERFLCFLQLSVRAYVSRARSIVLFIKLITWDWGCQRLMYKTYD